MLEIWHLGISCTIAVLPMLFLDNVVLIVLHAECLDIQKEYWTKYYIRWIRLSAAIDILKDSYMQFVCMTWSCVFLCIPVNWRNYKVFSGWNIANINARCSFHNWNVHKQISIILVSRVSFLLGLGVFSTRNGFCLAETGTIEKTNLTTSGMYRYLESTSHW